MVVGDGSSIIDLYILRRPTPRRSDPSSEHEASRLPASEYPYMLVYKEERNHCGPPRYPSPLEWRVGEDLTNASCTLVLRQAVARAPTGPWLDLGQRDSRGQFFANSFSRPCVEGPSVFRLADGRWILPLRP
jgi:hypothetical protein